MKKLLSIIIAGIILGANALMATTPTTILGNTAYAATCTLQNWETESAAATDFEQIQVCITDLNTAKTNCATDNTCEQYATAIEQLGIAASMSAAETPIEEYIVSAKAFALEDIRTNLCIDLDPDHANNDISKITAVIEEPLDTDLAAQPADSSGSSGEIRNCVRTTLCIERASLRGLECVAYMNTLNEGADYCKQASDKLNKDAASASYTLSGKKALVTCKPVQVILGTSGLDILYTYIGFIYRWGAGAAGIIAVLIIVVSGIQISASGGDQQAITSAKTRILTSIGGLALLFLSAIILYTINPTFFVK